VCQKIIHNLFFHYKEQDLTPVIARSKATKQSQIRLWIADLRLPNKMFFNPDFEIPQSVILKDGIASIRSQ